MPMQLTSEQLEAYHRDGYIVVEDLVSLEEVEKLGQRLREYTHGEDHPGTFGYRLNRASKEGNSKSISRATAFAKWATLCKEMICFERSVSTRTSSAYLSRYWDQTSRYSVTIC